MSSTAEKRHANLFSDWPIALTCMVHELYCIFQIVVGLPCMALTFCG